MKKNKHHKHRPTFVLLIGLLFVVVFISVICLYLYFHNNDGNSRSATILFSYSEQSSELIRQFFPGPPGSTLLTEDFESRCEVIEDFAHELIQIYGLENVEVIVTDDPELFSSDGGVVFGITRMDQKTVYINANLLRLDNVDVLEHLVGTVIHELRHIMQFEIMTLVNTRGVSYQRRKAWRHTTANYVDAGLDMEAYSTQSIEFDARNFTNRIWQKAYGTSVPLGGH